MTDSSATILRMTASTASGGRELLTDAGYAGITIRLPAHHFRSSRQQRDNHTTRHADHAKWWAACVRDPPICVAGGFIAAGR
jgi:hypothetical protein